MRKALIIGIDYYEHISSLSGCSNDARAVSEQLSRNGDGTVNFAAPRVIISTDKQSAINKNSIKSAVRELFEGDADISLFYFAGHGFVDDSGGFLCGSDCSSGDDGLSLTEVMAIASKSSAKNKILIFDSCHSGIAGDSPFMRGFAEIEDGTTILTASTEDQYAFEVEGGGAGVFTNLLVDAMSGAAANLVGDVTPGSVYAHIDQALGPWAQRPVFKTNVKRFVSLRKVQAPIELIDLHKLPRLFSAPDYRFPLDPSFEPERSQEQEADTLISKPNPKNTATLAVLQKFVKVNLVRPVDAPHMWHAAMQSKSCELTALGKHYRKLVFDKLI